MSAGATEVDEAPPADVDAAEVLDALVRTGRWADAAGYYPTWADGNPRDHAALLIAAGHFEDAHEIIGVAAASETWAEWDRFVRTADAVLHGDRLRFPDLVSLSTGVAWHACTAIVMVRVAETLGHAEVAVPFARTVLDRHPSDVTAAVTLAVGLADRGEYIEAVRRTATADLRKHADDPSPIELVRARFDALGRPGAARGFTAIGHYANRPKDPTQPVSTSKREMQERWRRAYRGSWPRRSLVLAAQLAVFAVPLALSALLLGNVVFGVPVVLAAGAALRARPIAGLDRATSRTVRSLTRPGAAIAVRRYLAVDVLTFMLTFFASMSIAGNLASKDVHGPVVGAVAVAGLVLAAVVTRARRRWAGRRRAALQRPELDPAHCRCLEVSDVHGSDSRDYVERHLFDVGSVPGRPHWRVRQCLETHARFLDLTRAELTIALPPPSVGEFSLR